MYSKLRKFKINVLNAVNSQKEFFDRTLSQNVHDQKNTSDKISVNLRSLWKLEILQKKTI